MKPKPTRHKEKNTFQFKRFSERINEIDIDVFHRVAHKNEENEEEETYFHQTLLKWNLLNLTEDYCIFKKQVRDIVTLPQLLNQKQYVIDLLLEYLKKKNILFLQPILELVVAVSRDLQKDFYEYFPLFLAAIIELLQTKDKEQIEYTFTSLAYLFKFLWRYLIKNIDRVLSLLLPLLADTQPTYINNFVAESFAFVVRKVKDKEAFIKLVFKVLQNTPHGIIGCGQLLFEVIAGVQGQFHSCAEEILLLYFNALNDENIDQELTYNVLKQMIDCVMESIHPQKCNVLWHVFLKLINVTSSELKATLRKKRSLELILQLLKSAIDYKNGKMLNDPVPLSKKLAQLIESFATDESVLSVIINASTAILLASNIKLMQETSSQLLLKLMSVNNTALLHMTVERLIHHSSFETLILPHILKRSISRRLTSDHLRLFAKIVQEKAPPCFNGASLDKWKKYILDVRNMQIESTNYILQELKTMSHAVSSEAIWILIIMPHLRPLPEQFKEIIKEQILLTYNKILYNESNETDENTVKMTFIFLLQLETAIHIFTPREIYEFISLRDIKLLHLLQKQNNNLFLLTAIDLYLTYFSISEYREYFLNEATISILNECIVQQLGSSIHNIRWIVAHIYSLFKNVKDIMVSNENSEKSVLDIIYLAESVPATVQTYRDKLLHLQNLTFHSNTMSQLNPKYYEIPLRYLMGNLYVNFSLLWEPVSKIIASYATKECSQFWPVFLSELKSINMEATTLKPIYECDVITALQMQICKTNDKPDWQNYRILLWKCMSHFVSFCEARNRDLTGLFIDFVNNNFFESNSEEAKLCDIKKHENLFDTIIAMEIDKEQKEKQEKEEERQQQSKILLKTEHDEILVQNKSYKTKLLIAQMEIYSKIGNPKVLYRETEMQKIYLDFLSSKNPEIQKAALSCLCTYRYKYLLPYKDHLYNLIDEKNFKNELAQFKVDKESNTILEEHRDDLMPILMRIIYAKMITKTGMRTGGKAGGFLKRKIILRFLAGIREDEMITFAEMAFRPFQKYVPFSQSGDINLNSITSNIINTVDLTNVIPPKRLQSSVNLIGIMMEQFGAKMKDKLLPHLLGILLCISAELVGILQRSDQVYVGYLPAIKNLRNSCISIIARFFQHFEDYEWKEHEIDALFNVAVFPWLSKLPIEGIHSPTALLKLFMAWSQNPRYYPLFIKHQKDNVDITPLPYIIKLLLGAKTHLSVVNAILEIIEKMLTLQDYGKIDEAVDCMEVDLPFFPLTPVITNTIKVDEKVHSSGINYGSVILLPHIPSILEYMKNKLKQYNRGINKIELIILSRISEFATDSDTCDTLLTLILPVLTKKAARNESEDVIIELITTVTNLVKSVKKPETHVRAIAPLLSIISAVPARKLLIQLYKFITERCSEEFRESMTLSHNLLASLNAWDRRWIDQPDFQKRLDAFSEINNLIDKDIIPLDCGVSIIYSCYFFLEHENDLSMKDCAGQCLKNLSVKLAKDYKKDPSDRRYLMEDTILKLIRKGITSKSETLRFQSIALLGHMSLECSEVHPILRDLSLLCSKIDPEVDFFENMQHLQLHRRVRALLKFCTISKTLEKAPNPKTLTQFILPLATFYLCNEAYSNKNSLIDAAIETVGTICKLLPWHHYEIILRYYLSKLKSSVAYQRQLIRLVVIILDSFHFDLSKYKPVEELMQKESISLMNKNQICCENNKQEEKESKPEENEESNTEEKEEKEDETLNDQDLEEKMNEELSNENIVAVEEIEEKISERTQDLPLLQRQVVLSQSGARRVVSNISKSLLLQLQRAIVAKTHHDSIHKVNKKKVIAETEEEDLMRVPIALALVKLLQKLPEGALDSHLPGIFMKLCSFLKSRLESVRRVTREILQRIMVTLGPKYLHYLLKELNSLLTKGFQVHVLAYTVHSILVTLKPYFKKYDINENLQSILSVCRIDLFGLTAEEKEVIGIVKNVSEAKSTKSFNIFHILAELITESCLIDLMLPLKEVLTRTHSHKTVQKVVECFKNIVIGLADNTFIPLEQMLIFLYGITTESIPDLLPPVKHRQITEKEAEKMARKKPDCFIIPQEPKNRMGIKVSAKTTRNTNAHVLVEFGLKLYHILLKREKISKPEFKPYMEPFVGILSNCLKSQHVKLCTLTLQCLSWILKLDLSSIQESISEISSSIFDILHKYAAPGLDKGDNFDLVMTAFKCMSVIVRDLKHFTITTEQLKILLLYAEQDLYDSDKQATAFALLKAIIKRKLTIPEFYLTMEKVAALSIVSELDHVRLQSRSVFYAYLMEYPLGKHINKHVSFYLSQLNYEMQYGRVSALEMIHSMITGFPLKVLINQSGVIFLVAGARLVNDDDPACRKLCAKCIKEMIARLPHNERNKLFDIVLSWLKDSKVVHRRLAAQLCGVFVTVEKDAFESRLADLVPLLLKQFHVDVDLEKKSEPGRFVKLQVEENMKTRKDKYIKDPERLKDHHIFQVLQLLLKISAQCPTFLKNEKYKEEICSLAEYSQSLLAYPHLWVRLAATQFLGFVLSVLDIKKVVHLIEQPAESQEVIGYVYSDPVETLKSLTLDLIAQLQPDMQFEELGDQVIKNLIFIARVLKSIDTENETDNKISLSLPWLLRRLRKSANVELAQSPKSTAVRTAVFKWIAGVASTIPLQELNTMLFNMMSPLVREMCTTEEWNAPLRHLAKEVASLIKKQLGNEEYARLLSRVQQKLDSKKAERRKMRTQQFVTDPELAAKRKIARQQKKKEARKRKLEFVRGKKMTKKRTKKEVDLDLF